MTIVTAMVSPRARPSASTVAPKIPARAVGRITRHVVSHQVAPNATDDSRRPRGAARITSRETADSGGRILIAHTSEVVKKLYWRGGPDRNPMKPRCSVTGVSRFFSENGASTYSAQMA